MTRRRFLLWIGSWIAVMAIEAAVAVATAAATAAVLVPIAKAERGYDAVGGEWIAAGMVLILTFYLIHNGVCNAVFGKRKQKERRKNGEILLDLSSLRQQLGHRRKMRLRGEAEREGGKREA